MPITLPTLLLLCSLLFSPFLQAGELPDNYAERIQDKLSRIAKLNPPREPIGGEVGTEHVIFFEIDENGSVNSASVAGIPGNLALARAAQRLILIAAPYSVIPTPTRSKFTIIRLSVTIAINDSRSFDVKEVRAVGGYKFVEF